MTSKNEDCCICLESMIDEQHSQICGHWMHDACARKQVKYKCPLCRAELYMPSQRQQEINAIREYDLEFLKMTRGYTDRNTSRARKQAYYRLSKHTSR